MEYTHIQMHACNKKKVVHKFMSPYGGMKLFCMHKGGAGWCFLCAQSGGGGGGGGRVEVFLHVTNQIFTTADLEIFLVVLIWYYSQYREMHEMISSVKYSLDNYLSNKITFILKNDI